MTIDLAELLENQRWEEAIAFVATAATVDSSILDYIHQLRWRTEGPSLQSVQHSLASIKDSIWVVETCLSTIVEELATNEAITNLGLKRVTALQQECEASGDSTDPSLPWTSQESALDHLLDRQARIATYRAWLDSPTFSPAQIDEDVELDDPWGEETEIISQATSAEGTQNTLTPPRTRHHSANPLFPLVDFLQYDLLAAACQLAANVELDALRDLIDRHTASLRPHRFSILAAIPPHVSPGDYRDLLPVADPESGGETFAKDSPWFGQQEQQGGFALLGAENLARWFIDTVQEIDSKSGAVSVQLNFIQHGAAQGVRDLDVIGEDLSLLSKMVYELEDTQDDWSLSRWQASTSGEIIRGYLASTSPSSIVADVRRLVLPYLYVLESRAERAGQPSQRIVESHLNDIILTSPLPLLLPLFEASKATLPSAERLIKQDLDVARLALACLYGSSATDQWGTMSSLFECLPVWDVGFGDSDDEEAAATTLESLGAFVRPSASQPVPPAATDMYLFFSPLPFASLSRALDILDVHLESGEILAKWGLNYPLRFFVQSAGDSAEQRSCAMRMARDAGTRITSASDWERLLDDMLKLRGGGEGLMRGALGMLSKLAVMNLFLEGLLASTRRCYRPYPLIQDFDAATRIIQRAILHELPPDVVEATVLKISREFYDNSDRGNLHSGNMKHAYAWYVSCLLRFSCCSLDVIPATPATRQEKEFIEATSRILSYNIRSFEPGGSVTPLEIRMASDRLDIIGKVLASSEGAYRHESVILEIVDKLGYRGDEGAYVNVMCRLIALAIQADDADQALSLAHQLLDSAGKSRATRLHTHLPGTGTLAYSTCWRSLVDVAHMKQFVDQDRGAHLLAAAVRLCPTEPLLDILEQWRSAEDQIQASIPTWASRSTTTRPVSTVPDQGTVLGSRRAARAAQMAVSFSEHLAGRLPSTHIPGLVQEAPHVSRNAKLALAKGVGWLLGEDSRS